MQGEQPYLSAWRGNLCCRAHLSGLRESDLLAQSPCTLQRAFLEHQTVTVPLILAVATLARRNKGCNRWQPRLGRGGEESQLGNIVLVTKAQCSLRHGPGFLSTNTKFSAATTVLVSRVQHATRHTVPEDPSPARARSHHRVPAQIPEQKNQQPLTMWGSPEPSHCCATTSSREKAQIHAQQAAAL